MTMQNLKERLERSVLEYSGETAIIYKKGDKWIRVVLVVAALAMAVRLMIW